MGQRSVRGVPGRIAEPGPGRGGLTGPGSRDRRGRSRRRTLAVPRAGRRPRGPCPGGTSTSPPPSASSKVPSGLGLPRRPAGKGLSAGRRFGRRGRGRGRAAGDLGCARLGGRPSRVVGAGGRDPHGVCPTVCVCVGGVARAFSAAPTGAASWTERRGGDFSSIIPKGPDPIFCKETMPLFQPLTRGAG